MNNCAYFEPFSFKFLPQKSPKILQFLTVLRCKLNQWEFWCLYFTFSPQLLSKNSFWDHWAHLNLSWKTLYYLVDFCACGLFSQLRGLILPSFWWYFTQNFCCYDCLLNVWGLLSCSRRSRQETDFRVLICHTEPLLADFLIFCFYSSKSQTSLAISKFGLL